jgi:hypothetical protein
MVVSPKVAVLFMAQVPYAVFGLHAYVPLVSLSVSMGFDVLASSPLRSLG